MMHIWTQRLVRVTQSIIEIETSSFHQTIGNNVRIKFGSDIGIAGSII